MRNFRLLVASAVLACGCSQPSSGADANSSANDGASSNGTLTFRPAVLPAAAGDNDDCDPVAPPDVCEWAQSVDAIVVGTIDAVRPLTSPVWVHKGPDSHEADTCDGDFVNIGLSIELTVTASLYGTTSDQIVVHVGRAGLDYAWADRPREVNGEIEWPARATGMLEVGTTIGMGITKVPDVDKWSLMGELPFTFESDGSTVFGEGHVCEWPMPDPPPGDFFSLEDDLEECDTVTNDRHDVRLIQFTQQPDWSHAAACHFH